MKPRVGVEIGGILLAAGRGTRFGGDKLLALLPGGVPMGVAAWRALRGVLPKSLVVVRAGDMRLRELFEREGARIVTAEYADRGMGASLAAGVAATDRNAGIVVALADMPWIAPTTIQAVAYAVAEGASTAAPRYRGERGHPIGFAPSHRSALLALDGDEGARGILAAHREAIRFIDVEDAGVLADVDTPEALRGSSNRGPRP